MSLNDFGQFLHKIRCRQKGTELAKQIGISYVYLLDIEKGARPVPNNRILQSLANNLSFSSGERETFFDLAAKEKNDIPLDVSLFISENQEMIPALRKIMRLKSPEDALALLGKCDNLDTNAEGKK